MIIADADQMRALGARVAGLCQPGDVIVLNGDLGSGKTTFVQGLGSGLGVSEPITSPTFVIARHYSGSLGNRLTHVDAYRLGSGLELDDLDLDAELASCITAVEWGAPHANRIAHDRLDISIDTLEDGSREVSIVGVGQRWAGVDLATLEPVA